MFADTIVAFDHARRVMQVIAPVRPGDEPAADYAAAVARIDGVLARLTASGRFSAARGGRRERARCLSRRTRRARTSWRR